MSDRAHRRGLAIVLGVVFLDLLGFGIIIPILPYYTRSFPGGTEFVIGLLAASYSAMQFAFAPLLGSLSDRVGRRPVLVLSLTGAVLSFDATVAAVDSVVPAAVPITRFSLPSFAAAFFSLCGVVVALVFLPE